MLPVIDLNLYFRCFNLNLDQKWHRKKVMSFGWRLKFRVCKKDSKNSLSKKCLHSSWKSKFVFFLKKIVLLNTSSRRQLVSVFAGFNENLEKCLSGPFGHSKTPKRDFWKNVRFWILVLVKLLFSRIAFPSAEKVFVACINYNCKRLWTLLLGKERKLALLSRNTCWTFNLFHVQTLEMKLFNVTDVLLATLSHCNRLQELVIAWERVLSTFSSERREEALQVNCSTLVDCPCVTYEPCSEISNPLFLRSTTRSEQQGGLDSEAGFHSKLEG